MMKHWIGAALMAASAPLALAQDESAHWTVDYLELPPGVTSEVGGIDFLPDGRLLLSTRRGQV